MSKPSEIYLLWNGQMERDESIHWNVRYAAGEITPMAVSEFLQDRLSNPLV
jgi:hypothetical protein